MRTCGPYPAVNPVYLFTRWDDMLAYGYIETRQRNKSAAKLPL